MFGNDMYGGNIPIINSKATEVLEIEVTDPSEIERLKKENPPTLDDVMDHLIKIEATLQRIETAVDWI